MALKMVIVSDIKTVLEILDANEKDLIDRRGVIHKLYKNRVYVIPGYQREIKWTPKNVQVLIDDLLKGSKFLGTITLSNLNTETFEVIDGQQRLTVLTMLIKQIKAIIPEDGRLTQYCLIENKSFPTFNELIKYKFDYERVKKENTPLYLKLENQDTLSQKKSFRIIWNSIADHLKSLEYTQIDQLYDAILDSDLNVIVNYIDGKKAQRKFCVDYFIDINNKLVTLDALEIIKAYAFKEDFDGMTAKWVDIQNKTSNLSLKVNYSRHSLFYQYFLCKINQELKGNLTKLGESFKTKEQIRVDDNEYAKGMYVWDILSNEKFYAGMLKDINAYLDFINLVTSHENGGYDEFKKLFIQADGGMVDETRILNIHTIISSIIRNDDIVPKMMVMKYYLDVIKPSNADGNSYKVIYYIKIIADFFSTSSRKKVSDRIAGKILPPNWCEALKSYATDLYKNHFEEIDLSKVARSKGAVTIDSGKYIARRFFTLCDCYSNNGNDVSPNEELFKRMSAESTFNYEHFLVNRNYKYTLYKNNGKEVDITIDAPKKIKKYIATIPNYIRLNEEVNSLLQNNPVYEKIKILESKIQEKGLENVIPCKRSQIHYRVIKSIFYDDSQYPSTEINDAKCKEEKEALLKNYYENNFEEEYERLIRVLNKKNIEFIYDCGVVLEEQGFHVANEMIHYKRKTGPLFKYIHATIEGENRRISFSVEMNYQSCEQEDGSNFDEKIEQIDRRINEKLHRSPDSRIVNNDNPSIKSARIQISLPFKEKEIMEYITIADEISYGLSD